MDLGLRLAGNVIEGVLAREKSPKPACLYHSSPIFTIVAGNPLFGTSSFSAHEALLRKHSPYFARILEGDSYEAKEHKVAFNRDRPEVVDCFVQWLYYQKYDAEHAIDTPYNQETRLGTSARKTGLGYMDEPSRSLVVRDKSSVELCSPSTIPVPEPIQCAKKGESESSPSDLRAKSSISGGSGSIELEADQIEVGATAADHKLRALYYLNARTYVLAETLMAENFKDYSLKMFHQVLAQYDNIGMTTVLQLAEILHNGTASEIPYRRDEGASNNNSQEAPLSEPSVVWIPNGYPGQEEQSYPPEHDNGNDKLKEEGRKLARDPAHAILAKYCASRMRTCSSNSFASYWKVWTEDQIRQLVNTDLKAFLADVMCLMHAAPGLDATVEEVNTWGKLVAAGKKKKKGTVDYGFC